MPSRGGPAGGTYEIYRPGRGTVLGQVQDATPEEVGAVVEKATRAATSWAALSPVDRARHVTNFANGVLAAADELALLDARNGGHPIRWTRLGAIKGAETRGTSTEFSREELVASTQLKTISVRIRPSADSTGEARGQ